MNINTSIGLRDRSRITLSNFKGLDTLSAAVDVSAIHATEMKNLISRDGVNHKRFGWKTQFRIRDNGKYLKIQGIFDFTIHQQRFLIVYAGKKFWSVDILNNYQDITESALTIAVVDKTLLTDTECKCYLNGNKAYFVGCGDLLVFSKWVNGKFELRRVVGNEDVYIPTTTENIGSEEDGQHYTRITAEEKNILSPYIKNLLFGPKQLTFTDNLNYQKATYYLDSNDFTDLELTVKHSDGSETLMIKKPNGYKYYEAGEIIKNFYLPSYQKSLIIQSIRWDDFIELQLKLDGITTVAKMENGDTLYFNYTYDETSLSDILIKFNNRSKYIKAPTKFSATLYYDTRNDTIKIQEYDSCDITYEPKNLTTSTYDLEIKMEFPSTYTINSINLNSDELKLSLDYSLENYGFPMIDPDGYIITNSSSSAKACVYPKKGMLVLYPHIVNKKQGDKYFYSPLTPDIPNIKVKMCFDNCNDTLLTSSKACLFGVQGGNDRLFIVDNTGNTVRWSKDEDFTYFGEKSWCVCGTSDKSITGMDRLNDSTLLIVKEYSPIEPSIFIITGNILTGETEAGTVDYTALFAPHGYQVGMGAVGEIINFNGDCLMVAKDGLYAVSLGENMTVDSRYVLHRSRQISNKLEKFDLSKAKCISFNGKFFVYVGGEEQECYVADNKYTASFEGDIQNVVNYEWWRWTNIPVNVWGFVENELWFGTEDGQLCSFTENFYDETFSRLHTGLATYEVDENEIVGFTLNKDIKVSIGDIFTPTCDFYGGITTDKFECINGETRFYLPLNDYLENETIYINNNAYVITKQDLYFSIQYSTDSNEISFYRNYKNKPLTVMDEVVIVLKDRDNKFPKWSAVKSQGGLNLSNEEFTATLSHKEPVVSKWVSGAMDLGTRAYSKSLTYLVLTGEKDLANRLKYGIKTRFNQKEYELLRANNDLDFNALNLESLSINSDFASSFTKRLNIRNVNFIMFYFTSDVAEDVALNSVQIEYKLHKRNIGAK